MERTLSNQDCINILTAFVNGQNPNQEELEVCANPPPCKEPRREREKFKRQYCAWESKSDEPKPDKRRLQSLVSKLKSQSLNVLPSIAVKTLSPEEIAEEKLKTVYKNIKDADAMRKLQNWHKEYARPFKNLRAQGWSPVDQLTADMSKLNIGTELASLGVPPGVPNLPPLQPLPIAEQKQEAEPVQYNIQDLVDAQEAANIQGMLLDKVSNSFEKDETTNDFLAIVQILKRENDALKLQLKEETESVITVLSRTISGYIPPLPTIVGIPIFLAWAALKFTLINPTIEGLKTIFSPVIWLYRLFVAVSAICFVINCNYNDQSIPFFVRYTVQTVYGFAKQGFGFMGRGIARAIGRTFDELVSAITSGLDNMMQFITSRLDALLDSLTGSLGSLLGIRLGHTNYYYNQWLNTPSRAEYDQDPEAKAEAPPPPYNEDDEAMPEGWEEHLRKMDEAVAQERATAHGAIPQPYEAPMSDDERRLFKALDESLANAFPIFANQISVFGESTGQIFNFITPNMPSADALYIAPTALPAFIAAQMFIGTAPHK